MKWSRIQSRLKPFLHEQLRERLKFHITTYQHHGGATGRGWIECDGREVATFPGAARDFDLVDKDSDPRQRFYLALQEYPTLSIDELQRSENEILRAISLCDRRLGVRRFLALNIEDEPSELVRTMYQLRRSIH